MKVFFAKMGYIPTANGIIAILNPSALKYISPPSLELCSALQSGHRSYFKLWILGIWHSHLFPFSIWSLNCFDFRPMILFSFRFGPDFGWIFQNIFRFGHWFYVLCILVRWPKVDPSLGKDTCLGKLPNQPLPICIIFISVIFSYLFITCNF